MTNTCAQCGRIFDPSKPHDCADRTAFTHGLELLDEPATVGDQVDWRAMALRRGDALRQMPNPVVDVCVVKWAGPCYLGDEWHYCSRLADHIGNHGCECGVNITPIHEHRLEPLTDQMIVDLICAGVIDYVHLRDEQGFTHEEALEQIKAETAESVACARGECNH